MKTIFLLIASFALLCTPLRAAEKYNVLFILSDDLRPELGCYGAPVQTPNLDELATRGIRFDRAYCQYPLCNPSRASLMTGRLPTTTGVLNNGTDFRKLHPDWVTLPQLFKDHGFVTVRSGKIFHGGIDDAASWSEGAEERKAVQAARAVVRAPQPGAAAGKTAAPAKSAITPQMKASDQRVVLAGNGESHSDYKVADAAIAAIERHKDQPFFIACGFTKPHAAPSAPQRFYDLYSPEKITLPADFAPVPTPQPGFPAAALTKQNTDLFWNREATPDEARLMIQAYRASVSWMDWNVGRVLDALEKSGLREKTIVVFWGDHGYHLGEMGKWSKHESLFDIGTRVPLLIAMPGAKGDGHACARIVQTLDLYPTLAAACGLPLPVGLEGRDLRPLLENPEEAWDHAAISFAGTAQRLNRAVRTERWRYIEWSGPEGGAALIDEQADPHERANVIADPANAETVKVLKSLLPPR